MNLDNKKKILAVMTSVTVMASNATPVLAVDNTKGIFTSDDSVICGYDQIYSDGHSDWIPEKPSTPKASKLNIKFDAKAQGEEYSFKVIDELQGEVIAHTTGSATTTGTNTILLDIPGSTKSGVYKLVGKIGDSEEVSKDLTIETNLALEATISSSEGNSTLNKINDLTIANYTATGGSSSQEQVTLDPPIDMTFKINDDSIIKHIDIYSNNVENHGPVEFKVSYKNENGEEVQAGVFGELEWKGYVESETGKARKRTTLNFDAPIRTDEIKISLTKTNQQWQNKYVIDEVMVWGHKDAPQYNLSLGQNIGAANQVNNIILTGKAMGDIADAQLNISLVKDGEVIKTETAAFENGILNHKFTTPENITKGTYQIVVENSDLNINKIFDFVVRGENTYEVDIDSNLVGYSNNNKLNEVLDGDYLTSSNTDSIKLWNKNIKNDEIFSVRSVKVYAEKESINTAKLLMATSQRKDAQLSTVVDLNSLSWQKDDKGDYIEFYIEDNFISHAYELKFDRAADIKEVDVTGVYFENNLLNGAKVTYNGNLVDGYNMLDNVINSEFIVKGEEAQGTKEIELSFEDGNIYELSQLFISSNYPESQGIKSVQASYIQDGQWIELDKVKANYVENQEQKRQMCVVKLPNIQTTKLKLKVEFNTRWSKGIITEINAIGRKYESGKAIASLIDHVDTVNGSTKKISLDWLEEIDENHNSKYRYELASSSNESIIDLYGNVHHTENEENVIVTYNVIDAENNKFKTGEIEVRVPKALDSNLSQADLKIDKITAYKNPAMGWVAYVEGFECAVHEQYGTTVNNPNAQDKGLCLQIDDANDAIKYWEQIDELIEGGMPVNILYIRQPWSWYEPTEGDYAWNDPNSACSILVNGAKERGIQLAFRVLTCSSACKQQATPQYVFEAGATGVNRDHDYIRGVKDPHLNNPIFKEKFNTFINAFGEAFNNENTAFIDAHGHGQWGEMNAMVDISGGGNVNETIDELSQFYVDAFPDVLLGGQLGSSQGRDAINKAFEVDGKNFVIRRDAFGSPKYLPGDERKINEVRDNGVPLFAENCYHHFDSRDFRWSSVIDYPAHGGGINEYSGDDPYVTMDAMMNKVVDDAIRLRANTIDLRVLEDCKLWLSDGKKYLDRFTKEGGYRISVADATFTNAVKVGESININSTWENNGVGILPNKNKQWDNKMKVAYALIDNDDNIVQKQIISTDEINAGDFEKGNEYLYDSTFTVDENIGAGTYRLAVSILNEKDGYKPGIQLANKGEVTNDGWLTLGNVEIIRENTSDSQIYKKHLEITVSEAEKITEEELSNVVPAVVNEFKAALQEAKGLLNDENATQDQIDASFNRLSEVMHMLSFEKGDKKALESLVSKIEALDESEYISSTWNKLAVVLEKANNVLSNENAMEEEVAKTYDELLRAFLELRLKPNKDKLQDLINKAESLDKNNYTNESWAKLEEKLAIAKAIISNEDVEKDEVDRATTELEAALGELVANADNENNNNSNNNTNNNTNEAENSNGGNNVANKPEESNGKGNGSLPKTGGTSAVAVGLLGLTSVVGGLILRRKKK